VILVTHQCDCIISPPATTTDNCPTKRYTNTPLGTKDRSGQLAPQAHVQVFRVFALIYKKVR